MRIKNIITAGCSFSQTITPTPWPNHLKTYVNNLDPDVNFIHRGLMGQGNELIQKKSVKAAFDLLGQGVNPSTIAIFVMWSGTKRKTFYVESKHHINQLVNNWKKYKHGFDLQLGDLSNSFDNLSFCKTDRKNDQDLGVNYNPNGGWYISMSSISDLDIYKEHNLLESSEKNFYSTSITIENIVMLQNFCKLYNIQLYQMFYMNEVPSVIEKYKNHTDMKYLYDQIDWNTFISVKSITDYLLPDLSLFENPPTDMHPNFDGHKKWLNEVMIPFLNDKHFFL